MATSNRPRRATVTNMPTSAVSRPPEWYRDIVIYQLHVRSFCDANGDGIGDFDGLTSKLDYLVELGVNAVWMLPFFPSPLRDDGYDIADYRSVNPSYGSLASFKRFLRAAHDRDLKVIIELVMNHTSDTHPWFQRARQARAGSRHRNFYVWSDDPRKYADTRIIFTDTESSNWTWDPVAQSYFWHRFYSHQPDLNFDNPDVHKAMLSTLDYWFDMGVDGVRLDAIPYLYEREGTNCENLPETHEFLKKVRAHMDANYPDRFVLAEANQWPEDAVEYFGDGDECHMCFHFPLMPRLYLAVQQESRAPIVDILEQTPDLPDGCQWALFLRNHDELTLEMVTDEERDYMYRRYAGDQRMRINVGIRRRLTTLLGDDRRKIELLNALLFSMPGTPIIYYGDEIGMGDNVYLGDRDSVRTPMQWNADRNAGFSHTDPQRLSLPVITDAQHHYASVNVDAQRRNPTSLWWWMRRMIALRQRHPVFARGSMQMIESDNPKVLTFLRSLDATSHDVPDDVLVVANLSRHPQQVSVPLPGFDGARPVELNSRNTLAPVEATPYRLMVGPHDVYWLQLTRERSPSEVVLETGAGPAIRGERIKLPLSRYDANQLAHALQPYIARQRWFGDRTRTITDSTVVDAFELAPGEDGGSPSWGVGVQLEFDSGEPTRYIAVLHRRDGQWHDAFVDPTFAGQLARSILRGASIPGGRGNLRGQPLQRVRVNGTTFASRPIGGEQSNSSHVIEDRWVLKLLRRVMPGDHPEVELLSHLNQVGFSHVPELAGTLVYTPEDGGERSTIATLVSMVHGARDTYSIVLNQASRFLEWTATLSEPARIPAAPTPLQAMDPTDELASALAESLEFAELLGMRTAELHRALADSRADRLRPIPFDTHARRSMYQALRSEMRSTINVLRNTDVRSSLEGVMTPAEVAHVGKAVIDRAAQLLRMSSGGRRIRVHGDLHLGQILARGGDITFIDFEGEPARPLGERSIKRTPLVDVAGMIRSFDYAANEAVDLAHGRGMGTAAELSDWAAAFGDWAAQRYTLAYVEHMAGTDLLPDDPADLALLLHVAVLQKAAYEVRYELGHRVERVGVPLGALARLVGASRPATV
jgi:maltose alpha-D-glucosyltransferase/alpha-amylase